MAAREKTMTMTPLASRLMKPTINIIVQTDISDAITLAGIPKSCIKNPLASYYLSDRAFCESSARKDGDVQQKGNHHKVNALSDRPHCCAVPSLYCGAEVACMKN